MSRTRAPQPLRVVLREADSASTQPRMARPGKISEQEATEGRNAATSLLASSTSSSRPPMSDEGPTFTAPWEARAFSMAVALHDAKQMEWGEFQKTLGTVLDRGAQEQDGEEWSYYIAWLLALETLVVGHEQIDPNLLQVRTLEILARSNHQHT